MEILLKIASVRVSSIQIMQIRVQNKGKRVWKSRYDGDVSHVRTIYASNASRLVSSVGPTIWWCSTLNPRQH